jgi:membrane protein implicated in regulation of membrane protease activity
MNNIPELQAQPRMLELLRARARLYSRAKTYQGVFLAFTIGLPLVSALLAWLLPEAKPYAALAAVAFTMLDALLLDHLHKRRLKLAAQMQEKFDCEVLQLQPNRFVAGGPPSPEDLRALSAEPLSLAREKQLHGWYPPAVAGVPIHVSRVICQRSNVRYDAGLRRRYNTSLMVFGIAMLIALAAMALTLKFDLEELLLLLAMPVMPLFTWIIREVHRQTDTLSKLETLQAEAEELLERAFEGLAPDDCAAASRQLQDGIFQHRVSAPLIFDWVYQQLRTNSEDQMNAAAENLVVQARSALGLQALQTK